MSKDSILIITLCELTRGLTQVRLHITPFPIRNSDRLIQLSKNIVPHKLTCLVSVATEPARLEKILPTNHPD